MVVVLWWWSRGGSLVVVVRGLYYVIFCDEYDSFLISVFGIVVLIRLFFAFVVLVFVLLGVGGDGGFWDRRAWG